MFFLCKEEKFCEDSRQQRMTTTDNKELFTENNPCIKSFFFRRHTLVNYEEPIT